MEKITADGDTLMRQAPDTIALYLRRAVEVIDAEFGKGFAKAHPDLVAAFLAACARDLETSSITSGLQNIAEAIDAVALRSTNE